MALLLHQSFLRPPSYSLRCALPNSLRCLFIITLIYLHCVGSTPYRIIALVIRCYKRTDVVFAKRCYFTPPLFTIG